MELLLLLRLGAAAFLLLRRLRDLRFAAFLLGAAFLREARRLFGAMMMCKILFCVGDASHNEMDDMANRFVQYKTYKTPNWPFTSVQYIGTSVTTKGDYVDAPPLLPSINKYIVFDNCYQHTTQLTDPKKQYIRTG